MDNEGLVDKILAANNRVVNERGTVSLGPPKSLRFLVTARIAVDRRVGKIKISLFCIKRFPKAAKLT